MIIEIIMTFMTNMTAMKIGTSMLIEPEGTVGGGLVTVGSLQPVNTELQT